MFSAGIARTHRRRALLGAALTVSISLLLPLPLVAATAAGKQKAKAPAPMVSPAAGSGEAPPPRREGTAPAAPAPGVGGEDARRPHARPQPSQSRGAERRGAGGRDGAGPQARGGSGPEGSTGGPAAGEGAPGPGEGAPAGEGAGDSLAAAKTHRHGKGGKGVKEREAREARERGERAKEAQEREAQARAGKQRVTMAPAAVTASAPAAPSAPAVAAAAPPNPAVTAPPTVLAQNAVAPSGSAKRGSAVKARRPGRAEGAPVSGAATPVPASAAATAGRTVSAPAARHAPAKHAVAKSSSPALIQTVTKIINVVPAAMRWIIAALIALALALAVSSRMVAMRARRLARQRRELLEDVGLLQAALLPALPERVGGVAASAAYQPASGPAAGGDFYDVFALEGGQVGVIVGDVSGHGRAALPHTTLVRYTLRAYLEAGLSPRSALQTAAPVLERQLGDCFATVVLATYDSNARKLVYASAGHPPPVVLGIEPGGEHTPIGLLTRGSSPPIGAGQPTGLRQTVVALPGEALVCFYTDGVVEARVAGNLYGAKRLTRTLAELGPGAGAGQLLERVDAEADRRPDDMAACLLHVEGGLASPRVHVEELELDRAAAARQRLGRFLLAGGLPPEQIEQVLGEVDGSLAEHGGIVLELRPGAGAPEIRLRRRNFAVLRPHTGERSHDKEVTVG